MNISALSKRSSERAEFTKKTQAATTKATTAFAESLNEGHMIFRVMLKGYAVAYVLYLVGTSEIFEDYLATISLQHSASAVLYTVTGGLAGDIGGVIGGSPPPPSLEDGDGPATVLER